ncbi:MAG: c-type cytochrome [Pseudomonadota bacterium]
MKYISLCFVAGVMIAITAHAQTTTSSSAAGNTENTGPLGAQIATRGGANGVAACASCHGAQGEGNAAAGFPRLAGQSEDYLARQMKNFTNGSRNNAVMSPIAKALTLQQTNAVSAYYGSLSAPFPTPSQLADAKVLQRGRQLATVGDNGKRIQGCANCHGPGGIGKPPTFPYLAGQHAAYLKAALAEWKNNVRTTDPSRQMNIIASLLNNEDTNAVTAYYAAQAAPQPDVQRANVPAGSTSRPVSPNSQTGSKSDGGASATQGVGTEQGAPVTGGNQGPGGGGASGSSDRSKP